MSCVKGSKATLFQPLSSPVFVQITQWDLTIKQNGSIWDSLEVWLKHFKNTFRVLSFNVWSVDIFRCYLTAALAELSADDEEEESSTPCRRHSLGRCLSLVLSTWSAPVSLDSNVDWLSAIVDSVYILQTKTHTWPLIITEIFCDCRLHDYSWFRTLSKEFSSVTLKLRCLLDFISGFTV